MPGLLRGVARTAVIAGTATAVSSRVSHRQSNAGPSRKRPAATGSWPRRARPGRRARRRRELDDRAAQGARRAESPGHPHRGGVRRAEGEAARLSGRSASRAYPARFWTRVGLLDRQLGGRVGFQAGVGDRVAAADREAVGAGGEALFGPLDRLQAAFQFLGRGRRRTRPGRGPRSRGRRARRARRPPPGHRAASQRLLLDLVPLRGDQLFCRALNPSRHRTDPRPGRAEDGGLRGSLRYPD